ncbi:MAG: sigma-70 family RNA polymerase sigma factor [Clostridia bacterium]|nr:sigma-70 family RNA polymerase sigma factor [Clostridia bacterium]
MMSQQRQEKQNKPTDEELVFGAQNGVDADCIALITRYIPVVKSRVSGYAGGELEPEDLAQEGMIGLMGAIESYDPRRGASFHTFALLCIDRAVISVVRATLAAKQIPSSNKISWEGSEVQAVSGESPEEIVVKQDTTRLMESRLKAVLSAMEHRVFFLYLGGCEYDDIARRLQISTKAVDNALCRARSKIQKIQF